MEDLHKLAILYEQFWDEKSNIEKMHQTYEMIKDNPNYVHYCALVEDEIVGSVMGVVCQELYGQCAPFLIIEDLIVDKKRRKLGIGKVLFNEVEKFALEKGCCQLILITEKDRKDAITFYNHLGLNPDTHQGYKKNLSKT